MRCPDCNKFVAYDEPSCEVNSADIDETNLSVSVTMQLNCADCGATLKDYEFEVDTDFEHECKPEAERPADCKPDSDYNADEHQFEVEDAGGAESMSRVESNDRHGKPIKMARYMKTFYGFTLVSTVRCRKCGETFDVETSDEAQASSFNEV